MNYSRIYNSIIQHALLSPRKKGKGVYYERHHIIPKCLGGTNDGSNLVLLTAREHFVCHKLLIEMHPDNWDLAYALTGFLSTKHSRIVSSRDYARIKERMSILNTGKTYSEEYKKKISDTLKVLYTDKRNHPHFGKHKSDETKRKLSECNIGKKMDPVVTDKIREKVHIAWADEDKRKAHGDKYRGIPQSTELVDKRISSRRRNNKPYPEDAKLKISIAARAHRHTEEYKQRLRDEAKAAIVSCPHCPMVSNNFRNMKRFHFDNCKYKINDCV